MIKKWIEALRSGDYQQGQSTLRYGQYYCCLGVLCDISGFGNWDEDHNYRIGPHEIYFNHLSESSSKFGLTRDEENKLIEMNDASVSFTEIADWIGANIT